MLFIHMDKSESFPGRMSLLTLGSDHYLVHWTMFVSKRYPEKRVPPGWMVHIGERILLRNGRLELTLEPIAVKNKILYSVAPVLT